MAKCEYCDTFILFGGQKDNKGRYCDEDCQDAANLLDFSYQIPRSQIKESLDKTFRGKCPICSREGPVDIHRAYRVWSALLLTSWSTNPKVSCKSCATIRQVGASVFSLIFGWWGLPWGILMTPVQITRNIVSIIGGRSQSKPSYLLEKWVRIQSAIEYLEAQDQKEANQIS